MDEEAKYKTAYEQAIKLGYLKPTKERSMDKLDAETQRRFDLVMPKYEAAYNRAIDMGPEIALRFDIMIQIGRVLGMSPEQTLENAMEVFEPEEDEGADDGS